MRPHRLLLPLLLVVPLAACSSSGGEDAATGSGGGAAQVEAAGGAAGAQDAAAGQQGSGGSGGADPLRLAPVGGAVVRTAELGVRVDDVRAAADAAGRIAREAGGVVAGERAHVGVPGADGQADAELVLRVPPERLDDVLSRLAALGEERARSLSSQPVGDQLVDLEARLAAQRASVERVRALLAEAVDLAQVVQIEGELTRRTADLESLEARLAALRDAVDLSTLTLRLDSEALVAAAELPGFLDGLSGGWAALVSAATVSAAVVGALLPFLPLLALAALGVLALRRRRPPAPTAP